MTNINSNCDRFIKSDGSASTGTSQKPVAMTNSSTQPQPESVVQYYRASSIALSLDGYNNTAALSDKVNDTDAPATPLPSNYDGYLLECLNTTIGSAAPLVDSDSAGLLVLLPTWLIFGVGLGVGASIMAV